MKCKYFRTRTKTINKKRIIYNYCTLKKCNVSLSCYQECDNKEYKQYKQLQAKQEYKYKPPKGKSYRYYNDIFGGKANRPKSEKYGLFVWLSEEQHRYLTDHPLENLKLKKIAQATFMEYYNKSEDEFREIFGRNYLK